MAKTYRPLFTRYRLSDGAGKPQIRRQSQAIIEGRAQRNDTAWKRSGEENVPCFGVAVRLHIVGGFACPTLHAGLDNRKSSCSGAMCAAYNCLVIKNLGWVAGDACGRANTRP